MRFRKEIGFKVIAICVCLFNLSNINAQELGKSSLDIIDWEVALTAGSISDRKDLGHFNKYGISVDAYFPFHYVVKKDESKPYSDKRTLNSNTLFSIRQSLGLVVNSFGSSAFGIGNQFSFFVAKDLSLDYEIGLSWVESNKISQDGMDRGLNFKHFFGVKKRISPKLAVGLAFMHLSDGDFFGNDTNYDMLSARVYYSFF